jgi:hypothetical protein
MTNEQGAESEGEEESLRGDSSKEGGLADLSELEKIKKELELEKVKAAQELEQGDDDEDEDAREADYLQKLISLSIKFDHHLGMFLMPAYIDCGLKYDHRLVESYTTQLGTVQSFLRLLEKVDGVTREQVTKECVVKLRNCVQQVHKNLVKPLFKEVKLMKKKPKMENLDTFKENWNDRLMDFQRVCDFEYQILDVKGFIVK